MNKIIIATIAGIILGVGFTYFYLDITKEFKAKDPLQSKIVFSTDNKQTPGYYFPTHDNLLVMDRSNAEDSEAFIVQISPNKFTNRQIHDDAEQLFYILSGNGKLTIERLGKKEVFDLLPTNFVHIPRNCYHQTFSQGNDTLKYLAIDCFPEGYNPNEPSWDDHARAVCKINNWDYNEARKKKI
ncbi:cupin domain-containing protein [Flavobacterium sp. N3904]|uniref:cupin domain-containing protein n=1 Tax=Flavobacterium sp. N3904 TaxID=2986835 RepID=UPI002223F904|nr:cupin domain-containing protein [Flavobacterium sp. N3904]